MEFCTCGRLMRRVIEDGKIKFVCAIPGCPKKEGVPADSLWRGEAHVREDERFGLILERAPHDLAAKNIFHECPGCGKQYMTLVCVGASATVMYLCDCGIRLDVNMQKIE